ASTALLAARAGAEGGFVLSVSESANNLALLALLSLASPALGQAGGAAAFLVLGAGLATGALLLLADRMADKA
ncbi:MFS transporter, partial [Nitratireductor sp. ZSWI3]|nr:MFS transporter [Nitratireductor sp. ZSWI3]